jgi:hypothetical protein
MLVKLLQKKITRVEDYIIEQKDQKQTEKVKVNISKLEQAKRGLSGELETVNAATRENWVIVRDQASKILKEATIRLREIE